MRITERLAYCLVFIAVVAIASAAGAAEGLPGYTGKFDFVHPASIWGDGMRVAVMTDKNLALYEGQELPVIRDKEFIGMVYITEIGMLNAMGEFYPHKQLTLIKGTDNIVVPKKDTLPRSLPTPGTAQIIYFSKSPANLWVFIDAGTLDSLTERTEGKAFRDGFYVGKFEMVFVGRHFSYGRLIREAIVPLAVVQELRIVFPDVIDKLKKSGGKNVAPSTYPPGVNPFKSKNKGKSGNTKKKKSKFKDNNGGDKEKESGNILLSPF